MVDPAKLLHENGGHFLCNIPDDAFQLPLGGEYVVPLLRKIAVALVDPGIFINGTQVGRSQGGDFPFQLRNALVACGHGLDLAPGLSGRAGGKAIGIPQFVHNLPLLHGGGHLFLLQQGTGPLHIEDFLVLLLGIVLSLGLACLGVCPGLLHLQQGLVHGSGLRIVGLPPLLQLLNFLGNALIFLPHSIHQRLLLLPVALHGRHQTL